MINPLDFVRPCGSRHQDASVNRFLDGYYLEGTLQAPLPTLQSANGIQLYLLHGRRYTSSDSLFTNIAVPDSELSRYQWQRTVPELQQAYLEHQRSIMASKANTKEPKPMMKRLRKEAM